jgi:hypothetical protein
MRWRIAAALKVEAELAEWRKLGLKPRLWWRDDDARAPSPALDRLFAIAGDRPLSLAVVPDGSLDLLAQRLSSERNVSVGQHGVDHINRRPSGEVKSEYAEPPSIGDLATALSGGRARMRAAGLDPTFYTPPWNTVDTALPRAIRRLGYSMLSAGEERVLYADLNYASAEIDVVAWKGAPRFKGGLRIMTALGRALVQRRQAEEYDRPIGLLTHHLDHDEATWRFVAWSMGWFDARFEWASAETLFKLRARPAISKQAEQQIEPMAQALGV